MLMEEKYAIVEDMFHGFDYKKFFELKPSERISFVSEAMEHFPNKTTEMRLQYLAGDFEETAAGWILRLA